MKTSGNLLGARLATLIGVACALSLPAAYAQDKPSIERGRAKFQHSCEPCHGAGIGDDGRTMLPGTDALRLKYRGALPAVLEQRKDLNADIIKVFVRQGSWSMPPFRPTELTDAEIADIAAYIADTSSKY